MRSATKTARNEQRDERNGGEKEREEGNDLREG